MTVLDERRPAFTWGAQDPTTADHLPEVVWDDDATRPHPDLVAELEALYRLEYTKPAPRPALPRRSELRNTPPNGIPVRPSPARAKKPRKVEAAPAPAPAPSVSTESAESTRQRLLRTRSTKAAVMALFVAADAYAAVTLSGHGALPDLFGSESAAAAPDASTLTSSMVLAGSADRAQAALDARSDAVGAVNRSEQRVSLESKAAANVGQLADSVAREKAAKVAAQKARDEALAGVRSDPKALARVMVSDRGWSSSQFSCLNSLWTRESGWNYKAYNASSGAYGIPQALPGSKMGTVASDWRSNPATQMKWGLDYIADRYGTPCGAWSHSQSYGWY